MAVAALSNFAQIPGIELETSRQYGAVRVKAGHDVLSLVEDHFRSTQGDFLLHAQLRSVAPGVRVTLPLESALLGEELRGVGRASEVVYVDYDSAVAPDVVGQLADFVVAEGEDEEAGLYAIALADADADELVEVTGPDRVFLVDARLLERVGAEVSS